MSLKQVVPDLIISIKAKREAMATFSGVTMRASAGKICSFSHVWSGRSSAYPRNMVMGTWVCVLINPGITIIPSASKYSASGDSILSLRISLI